MTRPSRRNTAEWAAVVLGAVLVAVIVKAFLIQAFFIPSLSMYSTLDKGDRVLVNKVSYHLHDVHRGDLVVFERPPGVPDDTPKDLIKRVIGLPGETIESRRGRVYVNGVALDEPYLDDGVHTDSPALKRQTVPTGDLFVMGDNRAHSYDGRYFGPIDADLVVGRAFMRVWPFPSMHIF
ncbi:MAG: signal peptidase [Acidimicrobiales bacterium]|nr:signal peptidase [Acidimicrobiales bacterium]